MAARPSRRPFDLIIRGGHVVDGTGNPWFAGDVAVRGDRIAAVGRLDGAKATREIDARGLVVAPGFIDMHTHSDQPLLDDGNAESKVREGVTLDVIGESTTVAPRDGLPEAKSSWTDFTGYWNALKAKGISMNVISEVSFQQIRLVVMGYNAGPATPAELERMKAAGGALDARRRVGSRDAVRERRAGVSGRGDRDCQGRGVARRHLHLAHRQRGHAAGQGDRLRDSRRRGSEDSGPHLPSEDSRQAELGHRRPVRGEDRGGAGTRPRRHGQSVSVHRDAARLERVLPGLGARGRPAEVRRDPDAIPAMRRKIKEDKDFQTWVMEHGGWDGIVLGRARQPETKKFEGMRIAEIAKARGDEDPADTCIALMSDEGGTITGMFHTMSEDDVRLVMKQPWVSIASDGSAINLEADGLPHPRSYSTNPRVLGYYVRDQKVLTLEDAVRKMTTLPAQILGLRDRGQIREGFAADLVVFDPATVERRTRSRSRSRIRSAFPTPSSTASSSLTAASTRARGLGRR